MVNHVLRFATSIPGITFTVIMLLVTSCTQTTPIVSPETIRIQYTFASQPWLAKLNICAGKNIVSSELRAVNFQDLQTADLVMRLGEPDNLTTPGFQIGTDDLMVIVNAQNPINKLSANQVRGLFTGLIQTWKPINESSTQVQVWVFSSGEDVQQIFEQSVLDGNPVTSLAHQANSPDEMSRSISKDVNAIGVLTRRWKTAEIVDVFSAASSLPVLAISKSEPQGPLAQILSCLQK